MKTLKKFLIYSLLCAILSSCSLFESNEFFGFDIDDFNKVDEKNIEYEIYRDIYNIHYLKLDCKNNLKDAHKIIKDWDNFSQNRELNILMYGGSIGCILYGTDFAKSTNMPYISNGVYRFIDRHPDANNSSDFIDTLNRERYNFSIAIYDLDNDVLYCYDIDFFKHRI